MMAPPKSGEGEGVSGLAGCWLMRIGRGKRETWREREGGFPLFSLRLLFLVSASLLGWRRRRPSPAAEEDQHSPPLIHRPLGQKLWQGKKRKRERERSAVIPPLVRPPPPFPPKSPSFPPLSPERKPPAIWVNGFGGRGEGDESGKKGGKWEKFVLDPAAALLPPLPPPPPPPPGLVRSFHGEREGEPMR